MKNLKYIFYNKTIRASQKLASQRLASQKLTSQKGFASIEAILSITIFLIMLSFSLGFFGIVHSGIVNSIAARNYAFDTFNNRTYLTYHRDTLDTLISNQKNGFRLHLITTDEDDNPNSKFIVTKRQIAFPPKKNTTSNADHRKMVEDAKNNNDKKNITDYKFDPVWIKAGYGICLNASCKPN